MLANCVDATSYRRDGYSSSPELTLVSKRAEVEAERPAGLLVNPATEAANISKRVVASFMADFLFRSKLVMVS